MVAIFTGAGAGFQRGSANILGGAGQLGTALLGRGSEGVSVNAATGNLLISHQDEFLVGLGPDLGISRTYNSLQDAADGDNGDQWQQSTTRRVFGLTGALGTAGSTISRLSGDGSVIVYEWDNARSAYVSTDGAGAFDTLTEAAGVWTWTDGDSRISETYEAHGADNWRLTTQTDPDGNALTFTYSGDKLDKATTADGGWTQYVWTGSNITEIVTGYTYLTTGTPKTLTRVRYAYDASDRLASVTTDLSPADGTVADGQTYAVTYTYDGASNRVASIAQSDGSLLTIAYDTSGRVETLTQTVGSGVTRVTTLSYGANYTQVTGPDGAVTRLDYDAVGQLTKLTTPPAVSGAAPQEASFAYDADGNVVSVTDGNGKITQYDHDANGNVTLATDPNGNAVQRTYDSASRLITELAYGLDESGASAAHYTQYAYDAEGHLRFAVNAAGQVTEYEYNASGQLLRTVRYPGHVYAVGPAPIDEAGMEAWLAGLGGLGLIQITENSYDARGGLTSTSSYSSVDINRIANSELAGTDGWMLTYDPHAISDGAIYTETWGDQSALSLDVNATAADQVISFGTPIGSIDLSGGERISLRTELELSGVITTAHLAMHLYDKDLNHIGSALVAAITGNQPAGTTLSGFVQLPQNAAKMRFEFYAFSSGAGAGSFSIAEPMVAQATSQQIAAPEYAPSPVGYVGEGSELSSSFSRSHYLYGQSGRLLERHKEGEASETFVYDGMGRMIASNDVHGGTTTFVFDDAATTTTVTTALGYSTTSVFNKAGELISQTDGGANTTGGTSTYQYDANGRLRSATDGSGRTSYYHYDEAGRKVADINHLGEITEYRYDAADRLIATVSYATALGAAELAILADPDNSADLASLLPVATPADVWNWNVYDDGGRLVETIGNLGDAVAYEYDASDRLVRTTAYASLLTSTQLDALKAALPAAPVLPLSDPADVISRMFYNEAGQLIATLDGEGFLTETVYDDAGQAVQTVAYATATVVADRVAGSLDTLRDYVAGSSLLDRVSHSVYDGQGLLRFTVGALGGVTGFDYDAAGRLTTTTSYAAPLDLADFTYPAVKGAVIANPADRRSWTVYDDAGRAAYVVDAEGGVTGFAYDVEGRLIKSVAYANLHDTSDAPSLDELNSWASDAAQATDQENRVSRSFYSERGELLYSVDPLGYVTGFTYDAEGRVLAETAYGGQNGVMVDDTTTMAALETMLAAIGDSITTSTTYDGAGRVLTTTDGEGFVTRNVYDALGRLTDVRRADGTDAEVVTHYVYDGAGRVVEQFSAYGTASEISVQFEYDGLGNQIATIDPNGNLTTYEYDRLGRLLTATNALNGVTAYAYDTFGNVVKVTDPKAGETFSYYDVLGRRVATRDAEGYVTQQVYNRFGEITSTARYAKPMSTPGEIGVAFFDPADMPPEGVDPFVYAAQLQAIADDLDGQADAAEAALPGLTQTAADAAQAAIDADALVTGLEAQIAALGGGGPIDFETERAAALADVDAWLQDREDWLYDAYIATSQLVGGTTGLEYTLLSAHQFRLYYERQVAQILPSQLVSATKRTNYIDQYYDNLTWRVNNLGSDRTAALADPLDWLQTRQTDLENWIDGLQNIGSLTFWDSNLENTYMKLQSLWSSVSAAIYDIQNNTYSTGWPTSPNQVDGWYNNVQSNPAYVPRNISHTTQQTSDYRATIAVNAYFDVQDATGYEGGGVDPALLALQAQLAQAQVDAGTAHGADDAAQLALTDGQTSATSLRAQADQAQIDADNALAAAQSGEATTNRDNFVLIDLSTLGSASKTFLFYDKLGRAVQRVDAEGYVETYAYNAFGQRTASSRFQDSVYEAGDSGLPQEVQQAYDDAQSLQEEANQLNASVALKEAEANRREEDDLPPLETAKNDAAAALAGQQNLIANLANQIAHHPVPAALNNPLPYLEATRQAAKDQEDLAYENYVQTGDQYYIYEMQYWSGIRTAAQNEINSYQAGNPLSEQGRDWVLGGAGLDESDVAAFEQLQTNHANAVSALPSFQSAASTTLAAYNAEVTAIGNLRTDAGTLHTQAATKQTEADTALEAAQDLERLLTGGVRELPEFELADLGVETETLFSYDNRGQLARITDAAGFYEAYEYDAYGRRTSVTAKSHTDNIADVGGTTLYSYDKRGLLVSETLPVQAYDSTGLALGQIIHSYEYDERGNLLRHVEAAGLPEERVTEFEYDDLDRLIVTKHDAVDGVAIDVATNAVSSVSGRPQETIAYDPKGNVIATVDAAGAKTVFFYDELDRKTIEISALGTYTAYDYDANGNVSAIRIYQNTVAVPAAGGSDANAPGVPSGPKRETTFEYDDLNRLTSSNVLGVTTGEYDVSNWGSSSSPITTAYEYDHQGNVVRLTEPNGNATVSKYDRLGRKVAQIDAGGYRTDWTYDADGNVRSEARYATKGFVPSGNEILGPASTDPENDRVTEYTYDEVGNRLTETRLNVKVHNGSGGHSAVDSTISYIYNGLGQVVRKTEATGDQVDYAYDADGRLTTETRESFTSYNGQTVTPEVSYSYDGLGNLVRLTELGGGGAAGRVTRYEYGAGGRLSEVIDAAGNSREFLYDIAGRLVLEHYDRTVANTNGTSTTVHEAVGYRYDALGRNLGQAYYTGSGTAWQFKAGNDYTTMAYNAFGDLIAVAFNRSSSAIASKGWQQQNQYDLAGRLIATNAGDGLWKFFGYDRNGNQTITIANGGTNLAGKTFGQALSMVGQVGVIASYVTYDSRNLAVQTIEEDREISTTSTVDLENSRTYNAFREVASETDALGYTTDYTYNTMGRLIEKKSPQVEVRSESGAISHQRPTERFYYDTSGRMVAQRDANNNLTKLTLLAGTGYDGGEALVTQVIQPGNGTVMTGYDIHGDARKVTDQIGRVTNQTFNAMGRLLSVARQGAAIQNYSYDQLGRQVKHWNSVYGAGDAEITSLDIQGRVVGDREFGGEVSTTAYAWNDTSATSTIGNSGGWVTTISTDGFNNTVATDLFGREAGSDFTYDAAGRLIHDEQDAGEPGTISYEYYNTGKLKYKSSAKLIESSQHGPDTRGKNIWFSYDEMGRLKTEKLQTSQTEWLMENYAGTAFWVQYERGGIFQDSTATYDAMGRMTRLVDNAINAGDLDKRWTYDANGNVRSVDTDYRRMTSTGKFETTTSNSVEWYRYDALNRVTLAKGDLVNGVIQRGADGIEMTYDAASQRKTSQTGNSPKEYYTYNDLGLVTDVRIGSSTGTPRVTSSYDTLGRLNGHVEYDGSNNLVHERFDIVYNARNQVLSEKGKVKQGSSWVYSHTVNFYDDTGQVSNPAQIGSPTTVGTSTGDVLAFSRTKYGTLAGSAGTLTYGSAADSAITDTADEYDYEYKDGVGFLETVTSTSNQWGSGSAQSEYDIEGNIIDRDRYLGGYGAGQNVRLVTDAYGQVIDRQEYGDSAPWIETELPRTHTYRFGGREIGVVGNDGTHNVDYTTLISHRDDTGAGSFRYGSSSATPYSDFDANHVTIAGGAQSDTPNSYMVRGGETLRSIALVVWGDASLWYKLADANGISGETLQAGQRLVIPNGVTGIHNNADTLRPYDPDRALGDLSAPHASPPRTSDNGCGIVGQILVAVVSIAVTAIAPISGGWLAQIGNGLLGNVAGQAVGNAVGVQDGFSFKSLALTGLSAGINVGLGPNGLFENGAFSGAKSGLVQSALRGAASSAIAQGVGAAAGLQSKFNWAGVGAAGVASGVGYTARMGLGAQPLSIDNTPSNHLANIGASSAAVIASAATRSAIEGTSFGDNIEAGLPDVIGQVLGSALAYGVNSRIQQSGANPVVQGAGFRSGGPEWESPIRLGGMLGTPNLPAKFGGARDDGLFDYSVHFGPASNQGWFEWGLDQIAGAWDGAERVFDDWIGQAARVGETIEDSMIVVMAEARDLGAWAVDASVRQANRIAQAVGDANIRTADSQQMHARDITATAHDGLRWMAAPSGLVTTVGSDLHNQNLMTSFNPVIAGPASFASIQFGGAVDRDFASFANTKRDITNGELVGGVIEAFTAASAVKGLGKLPAASGGIKVAEASISRIGGRLPINSKYAGKIHPSGVRFNAQGFPDFSPYAKAQVKLESLTGVPRVDNKLANQAAGFGDAGTAPKGYVWHHVEDGKTMQLVPFELHDATRHTGGTAIIRNRGLD